MWVINIAGLVYNFYFTLLNKASIRILLIQPVFEYWQYLYSIRIPTLDYQALSGYRVVVLVFYQDTGVPLSGSISLTISQGLGGHFGILFANFYIFSMFLTKCLHKNLILQK